MMQYLIHKIAKRCFFIWTENPIIHLLSNCYKGSTFYTYTLNIIYIGNRKYFF